MKEEMTCFFCKENITQEEMVEGKVEMLEAPDKRKVFSHITHAGVTQEVKKAGGK